MLVQVGSATDSLVRPICSILADSSISLSLSIFLLSAFGCLSPFGARPFSLFSHTVSAIGVTHGGTDPRTDGVLLTLCGYAREGRRVFSWHARDRSPPVTICSSNLLFSFARDTGRVQVEREQAIKWSISMPSSDVI